MLFDKADADEARKRLKALERPTFHVLRNTLFDGESYAVNAINPKTGFRVSAVCWEHIESIERQLQKR